MDNIDSIKDIANEYFQKFIDYLPDIILAIVIIILGFWLVKVVVNYLRKFFEKKSYDLALQNFVCSLLNAILKILVVITAISQLGVATTSFVAIIGAAGLAVGLALQGSLANFAGGVLIIVLKPFKIGDFIEAQGVSGTVNEISLFYTKLDTPGKQRIVIPNGQLSNNNVTNYSFHPIRRENLSIGISYDDDIKLAREILVKLIKEQEGILEDPAPQVLVAELADSSVNFSVRYHAPTDVFWDIHWTMIEESKIRLEAAGINIPFPQRDVHFYDHHQKEDNATS